MFRRHVIQLLAAIALSGAGAACAAHRSDAIANGEVDPALEQEIARSVVVHVTNNNSVPVEIQAGVTGGSARFMGAVGPDAEADILLDSDWFPTSMLYLIAIPSDGKPESVVGPLSANRGQRINFGVERDSRASHAFSAPTPRRAKDKT